MPTAVVVDDLKVDQHLAGALLEDRTDLKVLYARNGRQALAKMDTDAPDLVLTDMQMPEMDGLELVEAMQQDYPAVPVVLMTAYGSEDLAAEALKKGAASYVPKKHLARDLVPTVERLLAVAGKDLQDHAVIEYLADQDCHFILPNDEALIPPLINFLRIQCTRMKLLDDAQLTRVSVALDEAVTNAIRHGNLDTSSCVDRTDAAALGAELEDRRQTVPYAQRRVHMTARLSKFRAEFVVRDEGKGFDRSTLPTLTNPPNLQNIPGRGLLLIHTFMDEVRYSAMGNEVTMVKRAGV